VLVIGVNGDQLGIMTLPSAINTARENEVDLVEVAPNADPPVCRLMDYGKFKYEQAKKDRLARKSQKSSALREVRMRTRIGEHDMLRKTKKIVEFLVGGDKVKVSVLFRGREMSHPEIGNQLLGKVARALTDEARVEVAPTVERRTMSMVLVPSKKTASTAEEDSKERVDAKAENT
jgi:translation initiation factor IF-3